MSGWQEHRAVVSGKQCLLRYLGFSGCGRLEFIVEGRVVSCIEGPVGTFDEAVRGADWLEYIGRARKSGMFDRSAIAKDRRDEEDRHAHELAKLARREELAE